MGGIPFVRRFEFIYEQPQKLSPLVTRIMANNPGPFTFVGTGVFIIGHKHVAIIDPGPQTPKHEQALERALRGKTLTHILLTHHHADHSPMAHVLAKKHGCKIYGKTPQSTAQNDKQIQLEAGCDHLFKPDIDIKDGDIIAGQDWTIMAMHTPGHTCNHMCFALVEENTLFSGDHIMGWATSVVIPPDGHMGDYLDSLRKVKAVGFDRIRPTHGPVIRDVKPFIHAYIDHREQRERQVLRALHTGHADIMSMVAHLYKDTDKNLYPAAAISVLSHLIHLCEQGLAHCHGEMGLRGVFTPQSPLP